MRLYPKLKVNVICLAMAVLAVRFSYWQWDRHVEKKGYIQTLEHRLSEPPVLLSSLITNGSLDWNEMIHRRVTVEGTYDFSKEMVLRNRRYQDAAGVFVLTPLHIKGTDKTILVNRGFAPLAYATEEGRKQIRRDPNASFEGLVKAPALPKLFAPQDPETGPNLPWADAWLRVDLAKMQNQLPYPMLPVSLEIMSIDPTKTTSESIVQGKSERDEMFVPSERMYAMVHIAKELHPHEYPVPVFDTVIPPGRHLGYVFEWGAIALFSVIIAFLLQLRPSRAQLQKLQETNA